MKRTLKIGRWIIDFLFFAGHFDEEGVVACLRDCGAGRYAITQAEELMEECDYNCGFTYTNPETFRALVVTGPTTSGAEFQDTFTHEIRHLANAIAQELGIDLESEAPAYITGDAVRALADVVCRLGCRHCR